MKASVRRAGRRVWAAFLKSESEKRVVAFFSVCACGIRQASFGFLSAGKNLILP